MFELVWTFGIGVLEVYGLLRCTKLSSGDYYSCVMIKLIHLYIFSASHAASTERYTRRAEE